MAEKHTGFEGTGDIDLFTNTKKLVASSVGIGVATPSYPLEVNSVINTNCFVESSPLTGTYAGGYGSQNTGGAIWFGIDNSAGTIFNTGVAYGGALWRFGDNPIMIMTNNIPRLIIKGDGKIGIGYKTPNHKLQIHEVGVGLGVYTQWTTNETGATGGDGFLFGVSATQKVLFLNYEATDMWFYTSGVHKMTLDSNGNLGVGTSTPDALLDVTSTGQSYIYSSSTRADATGQGIASFYGYYKTNSANHKLLGGMFISSAGATANQRGGNIRLFTKGNGTTTLNEGIHITNTGTVGIGVATTLARLSVEAPTSAAGNNDVINLKNTPGYSDGERHMLYWTDSSTQLGRFGLEYDQGTSSCDFVFRDMWQGSAKNTEIMRIKATGRVGIGTTSPRSALDMGGASGTQGAITFGRKDISASADDTDVSTCNLLRVSTAGGDRIIGGLSGGQNGQMLIIQKYSSSNTLTIEHVEGAGTQDFVNANGADTTIAAGNYGAIIYICDGSNWFEILKA